METRAGKGVKFYRCEPGEPPCTLDELLAVNEDVWSDEQIQAMRALDFGKSMKFGGGAAAEYEIVCVGTERDVRLLEVLEECNSFCMDDENDRLALAKELISFMNSEAP